MTVQVRPCTADDIERLRSRKMTRSDRRHHEERWSMQERGEAVYLLAWQQEAVVGRVTVFRCSKYENVRRRFGDHPEMNAHEARRPGMGVGSAIIEAAEAAAAANGASSIGLAVQPHNEGAQRLYLRLGYVEWDNGRVIDRWAEKDDEGQVVREHEDECLYFTKPLSWFGVGVRPP